MAIVAPIRSHAALVARCRGEFLDMPGLHLTVRQAARLFGLDVTQCRALLEELVDAGFLCTEGGLYSRADGRPS